MENTFTSFLEAYKNSPQKIKDLIDSEEIGLFVDTLLTESDTPLQKPKLLVIISNRVLDVIPDSLMISRLEEAGLSQPDKIAQVKNFIITKTGVGSSENISSERTEMEAELQAIPAATPVSSIRTMAGDSHGVGYHSTEEVTHQSGQSELLQK